LCGRCRYSAICDNPTDDLAVDVLFERTVPKRLRPPMTTEKETVHA